ncbi:hypothetical protein OROGR_010702 [Orobanche gracilis]
MILSQSLSSPLLPQLLPKLSRMLQMSVLHLSHYEKTKKFLGVDFKRWQQNMLFYFTTLGLVVNLKYDSFMVTGIEIEVRSILRMISGVTVNSRTIIHF